MALEKIQFKFPIANPSQVDAWDFFRAFSTWIPDSPEIFIDVVDYRHVQDGVKIILVGHYVDVFLDDADGVLGLVYAQKRPMDGDDETKFTEILTKGLAAAKRLEADPIFSGKLKFKTDELFLIVNDRALAPNSPETFMHVKPALENGLQKILGAHKFQLTHLADSKRRFEVRVAIQ